MRIQAFTNEQLHNGGIIYKTLTPTKWISKDSIRLTYSRVIPSNDLPCDNILQLTPGIFQEIIAKAYEV